MDSYIWRRLKAARRDICLGVATAIIGAGVVAFAGYTNNTLYSSDLEAAKVRLVQQEEKLTSLETGIRERWESLGFSGKFPGMEVEGSVSAYCAAPQLFTTEGGDSELCSMVGERFLASYNAQRISTENRNLSSNAGLWTLLTVAGVTLTALGVVIAMLGVQTVRSYRK